MKQNVVAPSVGESITEVTILKWHKQDGDSVNNGDVLLEIESDKATVEVVAETAGTLKIKRQQGETVKVGEVLGEVAEGGTASARPPAPRPSVAPPPPMRNTAPPPPSFATAGRGAEAMPAAPSARKLALERGLDLSRVSGSGKGGRVTGSDVVQFAQSSMGGQAMTTPMAPPAPSTRSEMPSSSTTSSTTKDRPGDRRVGMSRIRQKIAERLVQAQHTAAILTTFNEVDMGPVMEIRNQRKEGFKEKYGVPLSFMSFFTRACALGLKSIPEVNAYIDGTDIVYHDYQDIGIAVGTDRGLVVPIIRDAGNKTFVQLEKDLADFSTRARGGKLGIQEMTGGTFTISNGGVYGSLLSTPILNPPQSAILGMHRIQDRPMAKDGQVVIRPMMFLALSYDHRIIDGKEAVTFLIAVKDGLESPEKLGLDF